MSLQLVAKISHLIEKCLQLCIVAYVLLVHIAAYCSLPLILLSLWFYPSFRVVFLAYMCWFYYSSHLAFGTSKKYSWNSLNKLKNYHRQYFPVRIIKTADLPENQNYLLVLYPHSSQAHSVISNFLSKSDVVDNSFPGIDFHVVTLNIYFYLPILREHLLLMGACPATESTLVTLLRANPSKAAVLLAGGAREMSLQRPCNTYTIISHRKGFVRIALKTGTPLVPSFSFGENRIFDRYKFDCLWLTKIADAIQRISGLRIVLPKGRGFFQNKFGFLPRKSPIVTVVGKPIEVPQIENPPKEIIDEYHEKFFMALRQLFDDYKQYFDPEGCNAELNMI